MCALDLLHVCVCAHARACVCVCVCETGCVSGESSLKFLIIGDMGGLPSWPYVTPVEVATAAEMAKIARQYSPDFILELGDNFYYDGVKNVEDKRFQVKRDMLVLVLNFVGVDVGAGCLRTRTCSIHRCVRTAYTCHSCFHVWGQTISVA